MVPLTKAAPWMDRIEAHARNTKDQWTIEVEAWFMKGILNALLFTQNGARVTLQDEENDYRMNNSSEYSICDRILFRDSDYTNINLVGISTTVCLFSLVCIASYAIESLKDAARITWKALKRFLIFLLVRSTLRKVQLFLKTMGSTKWIAARGSRPSDAFSELQYMERSPGSGLRAAG